MNGQPSSVLVTLDGGGRFEAPIDNQDDIFPRAFLTEENIGAIEDYLVEKLRSSVPGIRFRRWDRVGLPTHERFNTGSVSFRRDPHTFGTMVPWAVNAVFTQLQTGSAGHRGEALIQVGYSDLISNENLYRDLGYLFARLFKLSL